MTRKVKSPNPTTPKSKTEKREPLVLGEYFCMKEMQPKPVTMNFLKLMAEMLIEWVNDEDVVTFNEFFQYAHIGSGTFHNYVDRCPELKRAHAYALDVLGGRREAGAMRRRLDTNAVWKCQYQYGKNYKDAMEYAAKLAKKEDMDEGGTKIVLIEKMVTDPLMEKYFVKGDKGGDGK